MKKNILIINLGSTSTKVSLYSEMAEVFSESISHSQDELKPFITIWEQTDFRKSKILEVLKKNNISLSTLDAISCRGGLLKPVEGGIYILNEEMVEDMKSERYGSHPTSVGNIISYEIGQEYKIPVIVADPPVTDEFIPLARYSGMKEIPRISSFHALNQKRTARNVSETLGIPYEKLNLIVAHLGGGISVAAHRMGKVIDVNNALDGDGPFSPERAGTVPAGDLIKMCFSGKFSEQEMVKKIKGEGGLMSYLGTNSVLEVQEKIINGDEYALEVLESMTYQICKEIGACACVLEGYIDAIILTGSLAHSERIVSWIKKRTEFIAPMYIRAGENEMLSLAENALRYLHGKEAAKTY